MNGELSNKGLSLIWVNIFKSTLEIKAEKKDTACLK